MMTRTASEACARLPHNLGSIDLLGLDVPADHVGPLLLSQTGRSVWWTGRVAIGLRYEPPLRRDPCTDSALWLQDVMLETVDRSA